MRLRVLFSLVLIAALTSYGAEDLSVEEAAPAAAEAAAAEAAAEPALAPKR